MASDKVDVAMFSLTALLRIHNMGYLTSPPPLGDTIKFEIYYGVSSPWACLGAPEAERIARENGLMIHLKPMTVVEENGGIRVRTHIVQCIDTGLTMYALGS